MSEQAESAPPETAATLLEIEGLSAFYGSAQALEDVSFSMGRESIAILGRNGMGKTTLCNAIMGLSPPRASGSIRFEGYELVGGQSYKIARRGIGYVPQGRRLFPSLTVDQHLRIAARGTSSNGGSEWTRERVYDLFPRLGERKRNGGAQLSGGEQQMLAIGRALMTKPKLMLLDEPSMGLAPIVVQRIFETIREISGQGMTILLVEQNAAQALGLADRGYVIETGKIVLEDQARDLLANEQVRKAYLGEE